MPSLTSYKGLQVVTPDPTGAGGLAIQNDFKQLVDWQPKSVWSQSADPTSSDDEGDDFYPGSQWLRTDTTPPKLFVCLNSAAGAAVWQSILLGSAIVPVAGGGTGASTAATARANLGTPYLRATTVISDSGNWTKPSGLAFVIVEVWGGGGGSAGTNTQGAIPTGNGGQGGTSSFGTHLYAFGGGGGGAQYGFGGAGGTASGGDLNFGGNSGGFGQLCGGMSPRGGGGGAAFSPSQAGQFPGGGAGSNASTRGAGGGAGYSRKTIAAASLAGTEPVTIGAAGTAGGGTDGAAGAAGLVIVEEWGY